VGFTVVGTTFYGASSASDPTAHSIALPAGTAIGDLILVCLRGGGAIDLTDARLTGVDIGYPGWYVGGVGRATTLDDVEWSVASHADGVAVCTVLRGVGDDWEAEGSAEGDHSIHDFSERPGYNRAAVLLLDLESTSPGLIPDPTWHDAGGGSWDDGTVYYEGLSQTWSTGDPVGDLYTDEASGGGFRIRLAVFWPTPEAVAGGYLRQRQRPQAGRARQVPAPSRVRQIIP